MKYEVIQTLAGMFYIARAGETLSIPPFYDDDAATRYAALLESRDELAAVLKYARRFVNDSADTAYIDATLAKLT